MTNEITEFKVTTIIREVCLKIINHLKLMVVLPCVMIINYKKVPTVLLSLTE